MTGAIRRNDNSACSCYTVGGSVSTSKWVVRPVIKCVARSLEQDRNFSDGRIIIFGSGADLNLEVGIINRNLIASTLKIIIIVRPGSVMRIYGKSNSLQIENEHRKVNVRN